MNKFPLFIVILTICCSCKKKAELKGIDFRQEMRIFVQEISSYAKNKKSTFYIVPQNGQDLITTSKKPDNTISFNYLNAIDGIGREDLYYGLEKDNALSNAKETASIKSFLDIYLKNGKVVMVTDYCKDLDKVNDSYQKNSANGFVSFAAPDRNMTIFPSTIFNKNEDSIVSLSNAKNFLYLINPEKYNSKSEFIEALKTSNYDILLLDLFVQDEELTETDILQLQRKTNGNKRLVLCYISIGEAENYRYYCSQKWAIKNGPIKPAAPNWLRNQNRDWKGNYKVEYWRSEWKNIIYGSSSAYMDKILNAGFDGAYLDIVDAYEYYEDILKQ